MYEIMNPTPDSPRSDLELEVLKKRLHFPFAIGWIIMVKNARIERCRIYFDGEQLRALDSNKVPRSELPLHLDGILQFLVPETLYVTNESIIEVRDGDRLLRREKFMSLWTGLKDEGKVVVLGRGKSKIRLMQPRATI